MRYGQPSLAAGLEALRAAGAREVVVLPLYPQAAASSSGSTVARAYELAAESWEPPCLRVVPPFFDDAGFLDAFAARGRELGQAAPPDHVLFSFHGLPERHVKKSDPGGHCLRDEGCCDALSERNAGCYRAQCHATARALATRLELAPDRWSVSFQSRLGRTPWIRPHTDVRLGELARAGARRLAVFCPAFVADCLETLEEIGIRAREQFLAAGGEELTLVPSLNSSPAWADAVTALARRHATS
jgi:ferrochelatase